MSSNVLIFERPAANTGYRRRSDVERTLIDQGVRLFRGRTGPGQHGTYQPGAGMKPAPAEKYEADIL